MLWNRAGNRTLEQTRRERGVTSIEYAIMASLVAVVLVPAMSVMGGRVSEVFASAGQSVATIGLNPGSETARPGDPVACSVAWFPTVEARDEGLPDPEVGQTVSVGSGAAIVQYVFDGTTWQILGTPKFSTYAVLKAALPSAADGTSAWTIDFGIEWRWRTSVGRWVVNNTPTFATAAQRDAAIPEPTSGARTTIGTAEHIFDGTTWKNTATDGIPPAAAKLVLSSDLATSGSSWKTLVFSSVEVASGALSANTTQATVVNKGVYMVTMNVIWSNTAHRRLAEIRVNGATVPGGFRAEFNSTGYMSGGVSGLVSLAAGDQVSVAYYAAGGTLQTASLSLLRVA